MNIDLTAEYDTTPRHATLEELFYAFREEGISDNFVPTEARPHRSDSARTVRRLVQIAGASADAKAYWIDCIAKAKNLPSRRYQKHWNGTPVEVYQPHDTRPVIMALNAYAGMPYPGDEEFVAAILAAKPRNF